MNTKSLLYAGAAILIVIGLLLTFKDDGIYFAFYAPGIVLLVLASFEKRKRK